MYHVRLFIVEKTGFETAPRRYRIHSKLQPLLQKTCLSYTFETLATYVRMYLRTHTLACVCRPRPMYAGRGPLWSFYFQKQIFVHLKCYIFHFNTPQVNLIFDWALNWPWALEFKYHQETGAQVVRVQNVVSTQIGGHTSVFFSHTPMLLYHSSLPQDPHSSDQKQPNPQATNSKQTRFLLCPSSFFHFLLLGFVCVREEIWANIAI